MAALYGGTSVSGYNSNPPPDDGSTVSTNLITWAGIKSKLSDPINTFASSVDSNITSAFGKTLDGATVVATGVNYAATAADQGRLIKATASGITITTPDAGTVNAPFAFAINNQSSGTITLAGNATNAQTVDGATTQVIQIGGSCIVKTDGTNWFTIGLKSGVSSLGGNNYGFDSAVNLNLSCSVASNLLTVTVLTKAGNNPSASDPVLIPFRDTTNANGDPIWVTLSAALSISTNATGATLASQNSKPFRFWILAFNNAGTIVLALWHSGAGASTAIINPLNEGTLQSTTGISAGATSAGTFYTPNGTSLTSKAFRILGYLEYTSGLTTAGTYAAAPDIVQLFGPGIKKPGDVVQTAYLSQTSAGTTTSASFVAFTTNPTSLSITPSSSTSLVRVLAAGIGANSGSNSDSTTISRGSTNIGPVTTTTSGAGSNNFQHFMSVLDQPFTSSSTAYNIFGKTGGGTMTFPVASTGATIDLQEIMA